MIHKTLNLVVSAMLLSFSAALSAETSDGDRFGVNTHCYEFLEETDTPAPAGFKPVYVSHYGRHGARTGMKVGDTYDRLVEILKEASAKRLLTPQGDSLLNEAMWVRSYYDGMEGRLTRVGEAEQHELAERIYRRYRPVFRQKCKYVRVETSTVPRSIVSGECFVQTLTSLQNDLEFSFDTGEKYFAYINNSSSKEHRQAVEVVRDSLNALWKSDGKELFGRIFKDPSKGSALVGDADDFQRLIWETAREGKASGLKVDMFRHLSDAVAHKWWADEIRDIYMRHCNSVEFGEERMKRTEPLVRVMLLQAQQALATGSVVADLKFGHDHPLIAMAGYFGLEGVGDRLTWEDLPDAWADPMNIPFSSNMQMSLYRNKAGEVLVKFVYNGKERNLRDLAAVSGPYYKWSDVLEKFLPAGDERNFLTADWHWQALEKGAQAGYAQLPIFNSVQSIAVIRYPLSKVRTCIANDSAESADSTSALAIRHKGFAAINASYFNVRTLYPTTFVKDDGRQEGWTSPSELFRVDALLGIKKGKEVQISLADSLSYANAASSCKEAIAAGPVLLINGEYARISWPQSSFFTKRHPRTVFGISADGWGYLIVIDGRFPGQADGTTIHETSEICRMFGLKDAINMDGGGSSVLWTSEYGVLSHPFDNHRYDPFGQRIVPNIIYLR